jgi:hypothetical protein
MAKGQDLRVTRAERQDYARFAGTSQVIPYDSVAYCPL